jgi:protein-L-isoaspartate(D-aspartate) O-methyltransferase
MTVREEKLISQREAMVDEQLRARGIHDTAVLDAFAHVPRERFVPRGREGEAYADHPVPIGFGQTISQPYIVALMIQELRPAPSHRVLDVGAGSGYQAAVLAHLVGHVYAVERLEELAERALQGVAGLGVTNVTFGTMDGTLGWPEEAPFDGIICGAAAPQIPEPWFDQLGDGGRIVAPVGGEDHQTLVSVEKQIGCPKRRELCAVRFVKLIGRYGWSPT